MNKIIKGKCYIFGNNIDTDQIYPGKYLELTDYDEIGQHCLEGADPEFSSKMIRGDIIVAGTNFGCGSSREHAAITIKNCGIGAIVAESFARIFYRNAINLGIPLIVCSGIKNYIDEMDEIAIDIDHSKIIIEKNGVTIEFEPFSEYAMNILEHGGIKELLLKEES